MHDVIQVKQKYAACCKKIKHKYTTYDFGNTQHLTEAHYTQALSS